MNNNLNPLNHKNYTSKVVEIFANTSVENINALSGS